MATICLDLNVLRKVLSDIKLCRKRIIICCVTFNTLRPRQNCRHFADDIFKCVFLIENLWISLKMSLKFVPKVRINLNQRWLVYWRTYASLSLNELKYISQQIWLDHGHI